MIPILQEYRKTKENMYGVCCSIKAWKSDIQCNGFLFGWFFFLNSKIMTNFILLLYLFGRFCFSLTAFIIRKTISNSVKQDTVSSSDIVCSATAEGCLMAPRLKAGHQGWGWGEAQKEVNGRS